MNKLHTLNDMVPGEKAVVVQMDCPGDIRRRLLDLGLAVNTNVECVGCSPHGDPKAYLIHGAVIAIRCENSRHIVVREDITYGSVC